MKEKKKEFEEVDEDDSDPEMDAITRFFSQKLNLVNNFIRCNENVEKVITQKIQIYCINLQKYIWFVWFF